MASPAVLSKRMDFLWFVLPGLLAAVCGTWVGMDGRPESGRGETNLGLWIAAVLLVDVAHVYASLYRTYFDAEARRLHRKRLIWTPILCGWFGFLVHLESPTLFWSLLAYIAIFHFIKQHIGFALIYVRGGAEAPIDRTLTTWALWAGTLGPVVYWHTRLPTHFVWFIEGDLATGLPAWAGELALLAQVPVWIAFGIRRLQLAGRGRTNIMVPLLVLVPALNWHLGIVLFNDDRVFTITNVFLHGIPYLALVWVAGGRTRVESMLGRWNKRRGGTGRPVGMIALVAVFYGVLIAFALTEEALWDRWVWHDRPQLFGHGHGPLEPMVMALIVALLSVPQATHYVLDRWIWRAGPDNPRLAGQLGLARDA